MTSLLPKKQPEGETKFRRSRHSERVREQAAASTKQQKEKSAPLIKNDAPSLKKKLWSWGD
jgi:hypothetical protein